MRREHASILTDVLDALDTCQTEQDSGHGAHNLHITQLAARANLPHDRLKGYLAELVQAGLLYDGWPAAVTPKGQQFLLCYHSWLRLQANFGLRPAGKGPLGSTAVTVRLTPASRPQGLAGSPTQPAAPLTLPSPPDDARPGLAS